MTVLWEQGGISQGQLVQRVHLDSVMLAALLKRLDKAGSLHRVRPGNNERKPLIPLRKRRAAKGKGQGRAGADAKLYPLPELLLLRDLLKRALAVMGQDICPRPGNNAILRRRYLLCWR